MNLYLVRHPQTEENVSQIIIDPLLGTISPHGWWQVRRLITRLERENIERIISSDSKRCTEPAREICKKLGLVGIIEDQRIRERNNGDFTGRTKSEVETLLRTVEGADPRPPNGETISDMALRAEQFLQDITTEENILVISHGYFLKVLMGEILGINSLHAVNSLKVSNCALSTFRRTSMGWRTEYLNSKDHLFKGNIRRIHLFGGYGSGKTVLASMLSERTGIPHYSLDDLKYKRKFDITVPAEERVLRLEAVCKKTEWITEGTWTTFAETTFEKAEILIYLDVPQNTAIRRAIQRHTERKKRGEHYERDTPEDMDFMTQEILRYHTDSSPVSKKTHDAYAHKYSQKTIRVQEDSMAERITRINTTDDLRLLL